MRNPLFLIFAFLFIASCGTGIRDQATGLPTISSVTTTPNDDGSVTVTITGSGFVAGTTITVNGVDCTNVTIISDTQLTCRLPNGNIALVNIIVTSPTAGSSGSSGAYHTVFATSVYYSGNFTSTSGTDTQCQTLAQNGSKTKNLSGHWRAIVSDASTNAKDRVTFVNGASIKNTNGETVVASGSALWGGTLNAAIRYDENGVLISSVYNVRTATNSDGTKAAGNAYDVSCTSWTSGTNSQTCITGNLLSKTGSWLNDSVIECSYFGSGGGRLYCVNSNL